METPSDNLTSHMIVLGVRDSRTLSPPEVCGDVCGGVVYHHDSQCRPFCLMLGAKHD